MCQAIKEIREEGREEGRREGREEGRQEGRKEALIYIAEALMEKWGLTAEQTLELMDAPFTEELAYRL